MSRLAAATLVALVAGMPPETMAGTRYVLDATLDPAARTVAGTVDIHVDNAAPVALDEIALVLYPNRFGAPEPGIDDLNRPYVYPREEFVPGGITIERLEVHRGAEPARAILDSRLEPIDGWPGTLLRARLPAPLAPGAAVTLRVTFRTVLPLRFGPFGVADGAVIALGGWYPFVPERAADGTWELPPVPCPAALTGTLRVPSSYTAVVGGEIHGGADDESGARGGQVGVPIEIGDGGWPSLLASDRYRRHERAVDGATVVLLELPGRIARRLAPRRPPYATAVLDAVERIVRARPSALALPAAPLVVAEAPLRLELTAPSGPGIAIVSDRMLHVDPVLRDFHERALAAAVYAALLRPSVAARERPADVPWITDGVAAVLADRWLEVERPRRRTVYDWIALLNVFAIVDRFESAPKIPLARAFFPEARHADELRDGLESFGRDRPPGGTIFTKLRNEVGDATFAAIVDCYVAGGAALRPAAAASAGRPLDWLFDQWTAPYPEPLDYAVRGTRMNEEGDGASGTYRHHVQVERISPRPIREPVDIEVAGAGERRARLVWNSDASQAEFVATTPWKARRVTLDPDRRLLEDTRVDNARPRPLQVVLDSADVTVTSSEFGISGLFVARQRYDYTKDVGLIAFYSDRSVGMTVGPRLHFGAPNDPTSYRHNVYGFYTLADLRGGFGDDSRPDFETDGQLGGVGLRYDYTDEFTYDNPTYATKLRLFGDLYDGRLGSSFDYADWGARASVVRPLVTPRTLLAVQLMTAFSTPTGSDHVPNQGRYSLGGDLAVRGIAVEERLGENLALARVELRQTLYPEVDLSLFDVLVLRRGQLRLFVDTGHVEDRRSSLFRVHDFAVGVGVGLAAFYDFMGFYPSVAYVAVAQRVDRFDGVDNDVQFLFGTRQAF